MSNSESSLLISRRSASLGFTFSPPGDLNYYHINKMYISELLFPIMLMIKYINRHY